MRRPLLVLAVLPALLAAGCGSADDERAAPALPPVATTTATTTAPSKPPTQAPTAPAAPAGPASAVRAFIGGLKTGGPTAACASTAPVERTACVSELKDFRTFTVHDFGIGAVAVQGDRAIVTFTSVGGVCFDSFCTKNSDPSAGQPKAGVSFDKAYAAVDGGGTPQWRAKRVSGTWYVTDS